MKLLTPITYFKKIYQYSKISEQDWHNRKAENY